MATTFQWVTPESIQTYFTTELNSLANSTSDTTGFSAYGAEIDNSANLYEWVAFELVLAAQGSARTSPFLVEIWRQYALDGTNYSDGTNAAFTIQLVGSFPLDAATTARRLALAGIPLQPLKQKFALRNRTGQAFASSGNTFKYRRYNEQGV